MGYTHYYYVSGEFDAEAFGRVTSDFIKMLPPLRHLGVRLADGLGMGDPTISQTEIRFNGPEKCGHQKRQLGITWPAKSASGIAKNSIRCTLEELTSSSWFAGAELQSRACGGDCSHETFALEQKLDTLMQRYDGSTYELQAQGKYRGYADPDGTHQRNPADEVGKYFQCTKTAYKPYDLAVTVCLVIAKYHLGESIIIHSDGTMENWEEAMQLCQHFLGYGRDFSLDEDPPDEQYILYSDPKKSWLRVTHQELKSLGIADAISGNSHRKEEYAYLAGDCDARLFIAAKARADASFDPARHIAESHTDSESAIRGYRGYR